MQCNVTYLLDHADHQALLEPAELAAISPALVHRTGFVGQTHVLGAFLHGPLEEALAALASTHAIMLTGRGVAAHSAQLTRARGCAFSTGSASGRWRTDGGARGATAAARLRGLGAPTTVNTIQDAH